MSVNNAKKLESTRSLTKTPSWVLDELERWGKGKKFGHIQVNFHNGEIKNMNRVETLKAPAQVTKASKPFNPVLKPGDESKVSAPTPKS